LRTSYNKILIAGCRDRVVNSVVKILASILIIGALISSIYTVQIAEEYSDISEALIKFGAYTKYDLNRTDSGYLWVNITFENPSKIPINIYEIDYVFFVYNSSKGSFVREGFASGGIKIKIDPETDKSVLFGIPLENKKDLNYLKSHEKYFILHEYMEIYYRVDDMDYTNTYRYGIPHYEAVPYGGGMFG